MNEPQVWSDTDIGRNAILRRYMDLQKLLDLLHHRELYLRRADGFADRLEGALFPSLRVSMDKAHADGLSSQSADDFYRRARLGNYVSCWTLSGKDSMALWQLYGGVTTSVAVTSTPERLLNTVLGWNRQVEVRRVKYVNHLKIKTYLIGHYTDVLEFKHEAYRHEKELRVLVPQQNGDWESNPMGLRLPVPNLDVLVRSVVVAPEASNEFFEAVKGVCSRYGLSAPVRRSKLAFVPV